MLGVIAVVTSLFLADVSAVSAPVVQALHGVTQSATSAQPADRAAEAVLAHLNSERAAYHCAPLAIDPLLSEVASTQAVDLAVHHTFGRTSSDGKSPFDRMSAARISYGYAAENVALNEDIPSAERALWQSPGHRENILGQHYSHVGIAFAREDDGSIIVVEDFTD